MRRYTRSNENSRRGVTSQALDELSNYSLRSKDDLLLCADHSIKLSIPGAFRVDECAFNLVEGDWQSSGGTSGRQGWRVLNED